LIRFAIGHLAVTLHFVNLSASVTRLNDVAKRFS
jgi:hypothetical protein